MKDLHHELCPETLKKRLQTSPEVYRPIIDAVYVWVQTKKSEDWMMALFDTPLVSEWAEQNGRFSGHAHAMYLTAALHGHTTIVSNMSSWSSLSVPPKASCDLSFVLNHTNLRFADPLVRSAVSHPCFVGVSERRVISVLDPVHQAVLKDARSAFQKAHWSIAIFWTVHVRKVLHRLKTTHTLRVGLSVLSAKTQPSLPDILYRVPDLTPNAIRMFGWALSDYESIWTITRNGRGELYERLRVWYQYLLKVCHEQPDAHRVLHKLMRNSCSQSSKWVLGSLGILQTSGGGHTRLVLKCLHRVLRSPVQFDTGRLKRTLRNILNMYEQPASVVRKCIHIWFLRVGNVEELLNTTSLESIACSSPNHHIFEELCSKMSSTALRSYAIAYLNRKEHEYTIAEQCVMRSRRMMYCADEIYYDALDLVETFLLNGIRMLRTKRAERLLKMDHVRPVLESFAVRASYMWRKMKKTPCIVCWDVKPSTIPLHGDLRHALCGDCKSQLTVNQCPMCRTTIRTSEHRNLFRDSRFSVSEEDDAYLYSEGENDWY